MQPTAIEKTWEETVLNMYRLFLVPVPKILQHKNYLYKIYIVLGIIRKLDLKYKGRLCRPYIDTYSILFEQLEYPQILISNRVPEPILQGYRGITTKKGVVRESNLLIKFYPFAPVVEHL